MEQLWPLNPGEHPASAAVWTWPRKFSPADLAQPVLRTGNGLYGFLIALKIPLARGLRPVLSRGNLKLLLGRLQFWTKKRKKRIASYNDIVSPFRRELPLLMKTRDWAVVRRCDEKPCGETTGLVSPPSYCWC